MARPSIISLRAGPEIPILYEDRNIMAIDKPAGWLLAPDHWTHTRRNLQLALVEAIRAGEFWARSRQLKFLRYLHRLDAETSGVMLFAKNPGVIAVYSRLFAGQEVGKAYLAVVRGEPGRKEWICDAALVPDPRVKGRMKVDPRQGKESRTRFRVLATLPDRALVLAIPESGRTHQIRVHLQVSGHPVLGDPLYGPAVTPDPASPPLALRAIRLEFRDPFTRRPVCIEAPAEDFRRRHGMEPMPPGTGSEPARREARPHRGNSPRNKD